MQSNMVIPRKSLAIANDLRGIVAKSVVKLSD